MSSFDLQIILAGFLVALPCALLGTFLVLRKMVMLGDAISHAVLPGIVIAFLFSGERNSGVMLVGACVMGLFSTFLIEYLHKKGGLQSDASIGVTFTAFFALGIILISVLAGQVDLDQDCVLYGEIAYVPLDLWITESGTNLGPRIVWNMSIISVLVILFLFLFYKELTVNTFDSSFAAVAGISATLWHYALMSMVTVVTITSFEAVGAILVIAFLVGPAATAYLLTTKLKNMLWLSVLLGFTATVLGYLLASYTQGSVAGAISIAIGLQFVVVIFWQNMRKNAANKSASISTPSF
ncbi:MAG TPA: iron ABC transporter [Cytophagales bacterium]|jgi:manganese/zinc/iron transport system permease protein|nr:iron ABC transporter [Cytophagales bacterium]